MSALAFWKAVVQDDSNFLERVTSLLRDGGFDYCVIGGVAVNAYAVPVLTEDPDIILAADQLPAARTLLEREFKVAEFEYMLDVYDPGSKPQVQIQKDPDLTEMIARAETHHVLGLELPVANPADLIRLKIAAAIEPSRRPSKRGKDILDIGRLVARFRDLRQEVPPELAVRVDAVTDPEETE